MTVGCGWWLGYVVYAAILHARSLVHLCSRTPTNALVRTHPRSLARPNSCTTPSRHRPLSARFAALCAGAVFEPLLSCSNQHHEIMEEAVVSLFGDELGDAFGANLGLGQPRVRVRDRGEW